jgi:hypothetical protein
MSPTICIIIQDTFLDGNINLLKKAINHDNIGVMPWPILNKGTIWLEWQTNSRIYQMLGFLNDVQCLTYKEEVTKSSIGFGTTKQLKDFADGILSLAF